MDLVWGFQRIVEYFLMKLNFLHNAGNVTYFCLLLTNKSRSENKTCTQQDTYAKPLELLQQAQFTQNTGLCRMT